MRIVASDPRWKTSGEEMQSAEVLEMDEEMNELLTAYQKFDDRLAKVWSKLRDESDAKPVSLLGHALNAVGTARYKLEEAARALSLAAQHFET